MQKLDSEFYVNEDVVTIARVLIGKLLVTRLNNRTTIARIVETEAYAGAFDPASHAYRNRKTQRTSVMYEKGGVGYVYLCYGMHTLFNIITNQPGIPDAVLIRGVEPLDENLTRFTKKGRQPGAGPGLVTKVMGIGLQHNGIDLLGEQVYVANDNSVNLPIAVSKRIGIDYAGNASHWLYRFFVKGHPHVTPHAYNKEGILLL